MNLSLSGIMAGLIFSAVGLFAFRRGKSESNLYLVVLGIVLMGYTYFTSSPLGDWGVGIALCGGVYFYWDA